MLRHRQGRFARSAILAAGLLALAVSPVLAEPQAPGARHLPAAVRHQPAPRRAQPGRGPTRLALTESDLRGQLKAASEPASASSVSAADAAEIRASLARLTDHAAMRGHARLTPPAPAVTGLAQPQRSVQVEATGRGDGSGGGSVVPPDPQPAIRVAQAVSWSVPSLLADPNHTNDQYVSVAVCPGSENLYAVFEA
jgi:hypothetical protein